MLRYWLIGSAVLLGALLIASIAIAVMQEQEPLPEGTPERAVQLYLAAVVDDDYQAARNLLSADLKRQCTIETMVSRTYARRQLRNSRITLAGTTYLDGKAIVTARVATISRDGPFGTSENSHDQRFTLIKENGDWLFSGASWPYGNCFEPKPVLPVRPVVAPTSPPEATPTTGGE